MHFVKTDSNSIDYEEDRNFNLYSNFAAVSVGIGHGNHSPESWRVTVNWTVECSCGASEDDGEQMIECEECQL